MFRRSMCPPGPSGRGVDMRKEQLASDMVFLIHDFLTPQECEAFIERSEAQGYEDAPITTASGFVMRKDVRDNARVIVDDLSLAAAWWERAQEFLPAEWFGWR